MSPQTNKETRPCVTPSVDDDDMDFPVPLASPLSSSRPTQPANANTSQVTEKCTRSGRLVKPPPRYDDNLLTDFIIIN